MTVVQYILSTLSTRVQLLTSQARSQDFEWGDGVHFGLTQGLPAGGPGALEAPQRGPGRSPAGKRILANKILKLA